MCAPPTCPPRPEPPSVVGSCPLGCPLWPVPRAPARERRPGSGRRGRALGARGGLSTLSAAALSVSALGRGNPARVACAQLVFLIQGLPKINLCPTTSCPVARAETRRARGLPGAGLGSGLGVWASIRIRCPETGSPALSHRRAGRNTVLSYDRIRLAVACSRTVGRAAPALIPLQPVTSRLGVGLEEDSSDPLAVCSTRSE